MIEELITILGILGLITLIKYFMYIIFTFTPLEVKSIQSQFPPKTFAVITGGSDGLGKEYAMQLAQKGLNLVLIARNKGKLETASAEIRKVVGNQITIHLVVCDLSNSFQTEIFEEIAQKLSGLDISLLINNAGISYCNDFEFASSFSLVNLMTVNMMAPVLLTKALIPILKSCSSKHKVGIVNITSTAAVKSIPYFQVYSASKQFLEGFHKGLAIEYPDIVYLLVRPHFISTRMIYYKTAYDTVTPFEHVKAALKDLGRISITYGHWKHMLIGSVLEIAPQSIYGLVASRIGRQWVNDHEKARAEGKSLD